jgi:hypothetical protein
MRRANPTLRTLAWVIGGLLVAGVAGLAILYAAGVPLAETQRTLPAEPGATHNLVHEILLLGFVKVRVQELVFNKGDALTGMAMSGVAIAAFVVALLIRAVGGANWRRLLGFWLLVAAGAAWLAFDELASVHESAGFTWELWFGQIPFFEFEGDLFFALYMIPAVAFLVLERRVIGQDRLCVRLLIASAGLFALDALFDSLGTAFDEVLEPIIAVLLAVAFGRLAATHVAAELRSVGVEPWPATAVRANGAKPARLDAVAVAGNGARAEDDALTA